MLVIGCWCSPAYMNAIEFLRVERAGIGDRALIADVGWYRAREWLPAVRQEIGAVLRCMFGPMSKHLMGSVAMRAARPLKG